MMGLPPRSTFFPYTTLFRSGAGEAADYGRVERGVGGEPALGVLGVGGDDADRTIGSVESIEVRSEEHTSELQSHVNLVCRLLLEKKNPIIQAHRDHSFIVFF